MIRRLGLYLLSACDRLRRAELGPRPPLRTAKTRIPLQFLTIHGSPLQERPPRS